MRFALTLGVILPLISTRIMDLSPIVPTGPHFRSDMFYPPVNVIDGKPGLIPHLLKLA